MRNPSIRLTRHLRRMLLVASPLALVLGLSSGAQATTYAFAFSDTSAVLQAYGTLATANALNAKGGYDVLSIGGFADSSAITGLIANPTQPATSNYLFPGGAFFTYDNVLYAPGAPHVDIDGILFNVGGRIFEQPSQIGIVGREGCRRAWAHERIDLTVVEHVPERLIRASPAPELRSLYRSTVPRRTCRPPRTDL